MELEDGLASHSGDFTRATAIARATNMLQELSAGEGKGGLMLAFDDKTQAFKMISINSTDEEVVQMLVLAMETLSDLAKAQNESMLAAKTGGLN